MKRRDLVSSVAAAGVSGIIPRNLRAGAEPTMAVPGARGQQPNILIIVVDQMRYPRVFPSGINDVGTFLSRIMPNVHTLWKDGVKFTNHFTAAVACCGGVRA
jgi:arylsulfatase A-like enzyme